MRFNLEEYRPTHADGIFAVLTPEIGERVGWDVKESVDDLRSFLDDPSMKLWAIIVGEDVAGCIFLKLTVTETNVWSKRMANLGYFIAPAHRGRGIVSRAASQVIRYAFGTLGLVRLKAGHLEGNDASRRVIEKNGFKLVGIERNYAKPASSVAYARHYLYDLVPEDV